MNDINTERAGRSASLTWYGQAGFRLAAGDSRVLIDPFLTGRPDRRYEPPATAADFADVTLVLCTHEHVDHLDLPFLREFCAVNPAATIVVPLPVVEVAAAGGIDRARLAGAVPGEELHDRDVTVHPVPALHGIGGDEPVVYEFAPDGGPVRFLGYVLEIGGIRFYHSGDCLVYPELPGTLSALAPDVLMIPINGRDHMRETRGIVGNMNETEAAWLCAEVGPSYVIPMHYECIAGNTGSPHPSGPSPRDHTAWVPHPCRWSCMNAAPMQYETGSGRGRESVPGAHGHQEYAGTAGRGGAGRRRAGSSSIRVTCGSLQPGQRGVAGPAVPAGQPPAPGQFGR